MEELLETSWKELFNDDKPSPMAIKKKIELKKEEMKDVLRYTGTYIFSDCWNNATYINRLYDQWVKTGKDVNILKKLI